MGLGQKPDFPQIMEPQKDEPSQPHIHSCRRVQMAGSGLRSSELVTLLQQSRWGRARGFKP